MRLQMHCLLTEALQMPSRNANSCVASELLYQKALKTNCLIQEARVSS